MSSPSVLAQPALVLNESWAAIHTVTVRHALRLMFTGAAKAVAPNSYEILEFDSWMALAVSPEEPCIKTVKLRIKVPEVIVLTHYNGLPNPAAVFSRRNLFRRDHNQCQYCGVRPGTAELSIDHVWPRSRGGRSSWENCVLACMDCNRRKRDRTPDEAGMRLARVPRAPRELTWVAVAVARVPEAWVPYFAGAR